MEDSILERERLFLDTNEELEEKSKDMWQEIENVMKVQETHSNSGILRNPPFYSRHAFKLEEAELEIRDNVNSNMIPHELNKSQSGARVYESMHTAYSMQLPIHRGSKTTHEPAFNIAEQYLRGLRPREFQKEKVPSHNSSSDGSLTQRSLNSDENQIEEIDAIDDFIPLEGKQMSSQSKLRFLTAKTKVLYEECLSLRNTLKKQRDESLQLRKSLQKAEEEKKLWQQSSKQFEETAKRNTALLEEATRRCLNKDAENAAIQKDMDKLNRDLKIYLQKHGNNEARLNRVMQENEMLKASLKNAKWEEQEKVSDTKKRCEVFIGAVQKLERQKNELIVAFKKQLQLTDNLKRQRVLSDVNSHLEATENNFVQLLEWNPNPEMTET